MVASAVVEPVIAFTAGLASFLAPCVLPVLPGYVVFVSGGTRSNLSARAVRTALFVAGFSAAFIALGLIVAAAATSDAAQASAVWIRRIGGLLIVTFGLVMTGLLRIPLLERDMRVRIEMEEAKIRRAWAPLVLGASFAIGWSPCVGPFLAGILVLAGTSGGLGHAAFLLALYSLGLAVPFFFVGLTADRGAALLRRFQRAARWIEIVGGVILIVLGILVFTGSLVRFESYVLPGGPNAA